MAENDADQLVRKVCDRVKKHKGIQVGAGICFSPRRHVSKEIFHEYCSLLVSPLFVYGIVTKHTHIADLEQTELPQYCA